MHVLKKNKKLGIDNRIISFRQIGSKLEEEYKEVLESIGKYNKNANLENLKEVIRETFDLIQMCILILWKCHRQAKDIDEPELIQDINFEHKEKIITREWVIETGIEIDIKE
jgi:hypothetical protein